MNAATLFLISLACLVAGYLSYGRWLARKWGVDPQRPTPAHTEYDGVDYVPAKAPVLLGHHFSSIAGAGPITGPIQAAVFGWIPVTLWVLIGGVFFGAAHDFGSMFASVRNKGRSIGSIISNTMGSDAKRLFLIFAYLTLILVIAAFMSIVADTFDGFVGGSEVRVNGATASTSMLFIIAAIGFGILTNRYRPPMWANVALAVVLVAACVMAGTMFPLYLERDLWMVILAVYILVASVLPVWFLLQPRDYLCSFLLYGIILMSIFGILVSNPSISLPGFTSFETQIGYMFPALFITVACGAISGFHSLVSSGTTAKQIDNERDMLPLGFGSMLIECVLAMIAIICVGVLFVDGMPSGTPTQVFASGVSNMLSLSGLAEYEELTYGLVILAVSAFALTSLDTSTRLGRFMLQELASGEEGAGHAGIRALLCRPLPSTVVTIALGCGLALVGYQNIWGLFGAANQLLATLALLAVSAWLGEIGKERRMLLIPMAFMMAATSCSLLITAWDKVSVLVNGFDGPAFVQLLLSVLLLALAVTLMVRGARTIREQMSGEAPDA